MGVRAATSVFGTDAVEETRVSAEASNGTATMIWSGRPTGGSYPEAWGGPIEPGRFAAQVIASGGISNLVMTAPA